MPGTKRPKRRGGKKAGKRAGAGKPKGGPPRAGDKVAPDRGQKQVPKTFGSKRSSRSVISPAMTRRSPRGR